MLHIVRKKNEAITIDGHIKIHVLDVQSGRVQIAIDAPKHVSIYRTELYEKICKENKDALLMPDSLSAISLGDK